MQTFIGIDGGGTRTRVFAVDAGILHCGWGTAGLGNPNHASAGDLRRNLQMAIDAALAGLGSHIDECVSIFAGLAGITTDEGRQQVVALLSDIGLRRAKIAVDHDIRIALAGGLGGRPGIALVVGTGSSCYARTAEGGSWQTGGWEALISDEGSGYALGLEALMTAARMADGRLADSPLRETVFRWLEIESIAEILPRIHVQGLNRSEIAAFAPQVVELAAGGDAAALSILNRGARLLAEMVEACYRMLPTGSPPEIVITGGLGTARTLYRDKIEAAIGQSLPAARIIEPMLPPVIGAALLAMEQAGQNPTPELLERLSQCKTQ